MPNGDVLWGGYGHMGCCSLLAIQRIVSVDPQGRTDLDYRASPDQPELGKAGCSFRNLVPLDSTAEALAAQQRAETEKGGGAFDDPQRVATTSLAKFLDVDHAAITGLKQVRKSAGRVLYEWKPKGKRKTYSVVASRPYWLSFYAKDPHRTAWVTIAAYEKSCN